MKGLMAIVMSLISQAGTKLPLIWPDLLIIAAAVKRITITLNDGKPIAGASKFAEGGPSDELAKAVQKHGINPQEAYEVAADLRVADDRWSTPE